MKKTLLLIAFVSTMVAASQNTKIQIISTDTINVIVDDFIGYDQFKFFYYVKDNVFYKSMGSTSLEYKNPTLGKITKVDIQNPLKIVLFYESFNVVVLLDNQLNEIQRIILSENTSPIMAAAIGIASQNRLWIYNTLNQQISLFDYIKNEYNTISIPFPESIKHYQTDFNTFSWIDNKFNWYSCDLFGMITERGKTPDFDAVKIINEHQFIYSKNHRIFYTDLEKKKEQEIHVSEKTFKKFYYKDQILSIFTSKRIINYKITIP
jgi:hypothetical protein